MTNLPTNNLIYLSPLGSAGITDIKRASLFFDKIFVPIAWTTTIINALPVKKGTSWHVFVSKEECRERIDKLKREFEPFIKEGIIETDEDKSFNLIEKVEDYLSDLKKRKGQEEYEEKRKFLRITDEFMPIQIAMNKVLFQIENYHPIFGLLEYTPCFNDPLAIDILRKLVKFYQQYEKTMIPVSNIKREIGMKGDILAFNIISEHLPNFGDLDSKKIIKLVLSTRLCEISQLKIL